MTPNLTNRTSRGSYLQSPPPAPYDGPTREQVMALRRDYLSPGLLTYYREPLLITQGSLQYVWDDEGKQYLDAFAGVVTVSVGHCHPHVVERVREQVGKLHHTTTLYLHPTNGQLAAKLAEKLPAESSLTSTSFTNSGSEANELAVLMCREFTGRQEVISLRHGYHGGTQGTMSLVAVGTWKFPSNPRLNVHHLSSGYCYRCPFGLNYPSCELRCARDAESLIQLETSGEVAAFIGEPIQGVGGVVTPPPEYFSLVYEIVRRHGGLCIADEVQTAFGRTGDHYWGFQNWGVTPDLVTMAKGLGGGIPIGACVTRREIAASIKSRLHFNTFGGNPISMTYGLSTLEVIDAENLQENARVVGGYLRDRLLELQERHRLIGDVRGKGLMIGIELVRDRDSKQPASQETVDVLELTKTRGLLIGKGGLFGNVIRIKPPLCINRSDADFLIECLDESLELVEQKG